MASAMDTSAGGYRAGHQTVIHMKKSINWNNKLYNSVSKTIPRIAVYYGL